VLALILAIGLTGSARASNGSSSDAFSLKISEKEGVFQGLSEAMNHYLMWDLSFDRVMDRNMPFLELKNLSDTAIDSFHMTIGDEKFNFDCTKLGSCAKLAKSTPGFSLTSSVSAITGDAISTSGDQLNVQIGNGGLQPNGVLRFKIAIGVDAAFKSTIYSHPDFRTVLFDIGGRDVYDLSKPISLDDSDNSKFTAVFGSTTAQSVFQDPVIGPAGDTDRPIIGAIEAKYYNANFRRYGVMEPVDTFQALGGAAVPEPSSLALAAFGLLFGFFALSRFRRAAGTV
jgi:hypothetical protein